MIKSMTGFGKAQVEIEGKRIIVEIRTLNSKGFDLSTLRLPYDYKEKESEIRNRLSQALQRGKTDFYVNIEKVGVQSAPTINSEVFASYHAQLTSIAQDNAIDMGNESILQTILRLPEIFNAQSHEISEEEWEALENTISLALDEVNSFREQEGKATEADLIQRVNSILTLLMQIKPYEAERIEIIRNRMSDNLEKLGNEISIDSNRFEQEVIYYMERFDLNEEKTRLTNHCNYFIKTLKDEASGRKLGFISQEMGREINTIGSKANHAEIQKLVVGMKDELEKIKEQVLNIL